MMDRLRLRYRIEEAIEGWRDGEHSAEPGILHMYDPNEVKELARAIRDAIAPVGDTASCDKREDT